MGLGVQGFRLYGCRIQGSGLFPVSVQGFRRPMLRQSRQGLGFRSVEWDFQLRGNESRRAPYPNLPSYSFNWFGALGSELRNTNPNMEA